MRWQRREENGSFFVSATVTCCSIEATFPKIQIHDKNKNNHYLKVYDYDDHDDDDDVIGLDVIQFKIENKFFLSEK